MKRRLVLLSIFSLSSCSTIHYLHMPIMHGDLETQIEILFRRQNQASDQVMMLLMEEQSSSKLDILENAEQIMLDACKPLNEYAVLERDNQQIGLAQKQKVLDSINLCDIKTKKLEKMLKEYFSSKKHHAVSY